MCEILFFAKNNTNPDPEKDRRGCYKLGMPIAVKEDGAIWGRLESKQQWISEGLPAASWPSQGKTAILKIPGVFASKAQEFLNSQVEDDLGVPLTDETGRPVIYRRRRWRLLVDSVPAAVRTAIAINGEYTTTVAAIRNYLHRIRDDAQYTGFD